MSVTTCIRRHVIKEDEIGGRWRYVDGVLVAGPDRSCTRCGRPPTEEGHDACLGRIQGAISACCGHGVKDGHVLFAGAKGIKNGRA